jgi:acetylornithine deacetylase/succinyl-diaminopimelate desuccinylase-like protein
METLKMVLKAVWDHIDSHRSRCLADLAILCGQPSISAQKVGLDEMAGLCVGTMRAYGLKAHTIPIPGGPPIVYGERQGRSAKTLLFYDHYDVQPPEPLDLWESPPFELTARGGRVFARGVADNKGNLLSRLAAVRAWLDATGELPVSVKFLVEGEEEVGSPHLATFVAANTELLAADACIWESGGVNWQGRPVITLGLKGILYVELEARGANRDIHSAQATSVVNPAWRLVWALATLKDQNENILIDGHYDDVRPPTAEDLEAVSRIPSEDAQTKASLGITEYLLGLSGPDLRIRNLFAPTCTICGLWSGYSGDGSKTVLPSTAHAKIDFRLVPDMDPADVLTRLRRHLDRHGFAGISVRALDFGERAWRTPMNDPFVRLVSDAARTVYGLEPVLSPTMTGSGPMYPFGAHLGVPIASSGASNPDSRAHAPNENIKVEDFVLAAKHVATVMDMMA